jgi:chorismate synthase
MLLRGRVPRQLTNAPTCARFQLLVVVAEAMVALVLAEAVLEKFGGDSVTETRRNFNSYMQNLNFS